MKKRLVNVFLGITVLSLFFTGCGHQGSSEKITVFGQVTKIEGEHITIALVESSNTEIKEDQSVGAKASDDDKVKQENGKGNNGESIDKKGGDKADAKDVKAVDPKNLTLTGEEQVIAVSDQTEVKKAEPSGSGQDETGTDKKENAGGGRKSSSEKSDSGKPGDKEVFKNDDVSQDEPAGLDDIRMGDVVTVIMDGAEAQTVIIRSETAAAGKLKRADSVNNKKNPAAAGEIELSGVLQVDGKNDTSDDENVSASKENQNVVLVKGGGTLSMTTGKLSKAGTTSSVDESSFFGVNAVFVTTAGSESSIKSSEITSAAEGANAIFSTGGQALTHVGKVKIETSGDSSSGLNATYGGTIDATDVDITTSGGNSAPIAAKKGGGAVSVTGGTVSASGNSSPCIYSSGIIKVENVTGSAQGGPTLVVEGPNSVSLKTCDLSGSGEHGVMMYQEAAGHDKEGEEKDGIAKLKAVDSILETTSVGPMFYVTNTKAEALLENTQLKFRGKVLVKAAGNDTNNWGTAGSNGGSFTLTGTAQELSGDIICDNISSIRVKLTEKSSLKGTVNGENKGRNVEISLDKTSKWELTGDSYVNVIKNEDESCSNIQSNGNTIYYDGSNAENSWLDSKTVALADGGKLVPKS